MEPAAVDGVLGSWSPGTQWRPRCRALVGVSWVLALERVDGVPLDEEKPPRRVLVSVGVQSRPLQPQASTTAREMEGVSPSRQGWGRPGLRWLLLLLDHLQLCTLSSVLCTRHSVRDPSLPPRSK